MSDRTIRILYLAADPALTLDQTGGAGTHMRGTIEALRRSGVEVEAMVGTPPGREATPTIAQRSQPAARRIAPEPIRLIARDLRLLAHARAFRRAPFGDFDCVYERSGYLLDVGKRIARERNVPYIVETDGILVATRAAAYGAALRPLGERLERSKIRGAALTVVMSDASARDIADRYAIPPERILMKGLGVERELFEMSSRGTPAVDVGFAGTFQPYHGVELLLRALEQLPYRSAALVGDGPGRAGIEASKLPSVELTGLLPREQALKRLRDCRVLVIPESAETLYPIKLLEYAALRRPVVAPRRAAFEEFREDGKPLIFEFDPGDANDLARAIEEAAGPAGDVRAEALSSLVAARYTWDAVGERLATGLRRVLAETD